MIVRSVHGEDKVWAFGLRDQLRKDSLGISNDLTIEQHCTMRQLKDDNKHGHFKNEKLIIKDNQYQPETDRGNPGKQRTEPVMKSTTKEFYDPEQARPRAHITLIAQKINNLGVIKNVHFIGWKETVCLNVLDVARIIPN